MEWQNDAVQGASETHLEVQHLPAFWRAQAATQEALSNDQTAAALRLSAKQLEHSLREQSEQVLSITEAATRSGYSADHLRRLIRQGRIPNAGRTNSPKIRRLDLPARGAKKRPMAVEPKTADTSNAEIVQSIIKGVG